MAKLHTLTRDTLTVAEAGKRLGISRNVAYDCVARGEIPAIRLGKRLLVPRLAFERLLNGGPFVHVPKTAHAALDTSETETV
jgi:excisionase family DNA binding protein